MGALTEDCSRRIVAGKASLAHTRAVDNLVSFDSCLCTQFDIPVGCRTSISLHKPNRSFKARKLELTHCR